MITIDHMRCDTCGTCVGVCPADSLMIVLDRLGWDEDACTDCRVCIAVCPVTALGGGDD